MIRLSLLLACFALLAAACGVPQAMEEAARDKAARQMRDIATMIEIQYLTSNRLPSSLDELNAVDPSTGQVLYERVPTDPWGRPFRYEVRGPRAYSLRTLGADGAAETADDQVLEREIG
ncbi:MAG: type II secretion system protein GspG [Planctomycetota bacterium]|jgi:general secretion pathway protein G